MDDNEERDQLLEALVGCQNAGKLTTEQAAEIKRTINTLYSPLHSFLFDLTSITFYI